MTWWQTSELASCRRIFLRGFEMRVHIGAHAFEKLGPQRVTFNIELFVALGSSTPAHDTLGEVVDYDFVREIVRGRVQRGHIQLQETLCDEIADELLRTPGVRAVRVRTEKPDVYPDCDAVGVEIFRTHPPSP